MTPEQRKACQELVITPPSGMSRISREEFVRLFPSAVDGGKVSADMLKKAYTARDPELLQCAMIVGATFGYSAEHLDILSHLLESDWHFSHEDIVSALSTLRTPAAVESLFRATQWIPPYLEYDESRALASKAIWAIGDIAGPEAAEMLRTLAKSGDPNLREKAAEQLKRRIGK